TFLIELEPHTDERGFFARQFCHQELAAKGLDFDIKQCNLSGNLYKGTLRGMHYQKEPFPEIKLVSCLQGSFFDVLVDLRPNSPTYLKYVYAELSAANHKMLYIPPLVAHGFQTLEDNTVVYYQLGEFFHPEAYAGVRWNDPKLNIPWPPCNHRIINERDNNYALL
ncbi:MAG: dTDP-4-dehydrorhamnose 3,5-epimerase family protein, partial [Elusimicrobiaceae bacterium]|nr:dTDP-4-dehydrorhamnose 3,5-epimerase family protein [Elusimicrobiaceae bacterium]